jgi:hypothetical protein
LLPIIFLAVCALDIPPIARHCDFVIRVMVLSLYDWQNCP